MSSKYTQYGMHFAALVELAAELEMAASAEVASGRAPEEKI